MNKTLLSKDAKGKIREWSINVNKNEMTVSYGTKGGKMIVKTQKIDSGKNIGKKNETSLEEQAILEALSKIKKKRDEGYSSDGEIPVPSPMLAHDYADHKNKITFPCFIQPKLDGYRMITINGEMTSRNNKQYTSLIDTPLHLEIIKLGMSLDGELYVHDKDFSFESYGVLRKKKMSIGDLDKINKIKFYVFDIIDDHLTFKERLLKLNTLKSKWIIPVDTFVCSNEEDIERHHQKFIEEGYEGSMIRNTLSKYSHSRSYDLLKKKDFEDKEFEIVSFDYEKKFSDDNLKPVVWKCKTQEGKTFDVQSKGTRQERHKLYIKAEKYIGKSLTVKFFGLTEDGIPRFPKTLRSGMACFQ